MKRIRIFLALLAARIVKTALRVTHRGGTALPGRVAMRLCPDILRRLAGQVQTVIVTGTNGKTTSCRIVEQLMAEAGYRYFANHAGANLIQGIATEFCLDARLSGRMRHDHAVIECDEAASKEVCRQLSPRCILVTNVFSDQLDRFGDVTNTLAQIRTGIGNAPGATVCLNADCSLSASLPEGLENEFVFYGVETPIYKEKVREVSDASRCRRCGAAYAYDWRTYGHLGGFRCPDCGYARPAARAAVTAVQSQTSEGSRVTLHLDGAEYPAEIAVPGGYNIYNAAGAAAVGLALGLAPAVILAALRSFRCGFGRMEKLTLGERQARMILVKNPAGCNQTLNFLANLEGDALFAVCLNDHVGDGTDISWIWDADFEKLLTLGARLRGVCCAGTRGADMALRLKYAGFDESRLQVCPDYDSLIAAMTAQDAPIVIMPTYSAMLELRGKLSAKYGFGEFWE